MLTLSNSPLFEIDAKNLECCLCYGSSLLTKLYKLKFLHILNSEVSQHLCIHFKLRVLNIIYFYCAVCLICKDAQNKVA